MSSEWPLVRLEEITSVLGDGLHGTPIYDDGGDYHFINGNNLLEGRIVINEKTKRVTEAEAHKHRKNLNERTILVSINGTLGNIAFYCGERVILGKSACYFNVDTGVDKHFVRYVLQSDTFQNYIHNLATGSTIKNVSLRLMRDFSFQLPPFEVQERISATLKALDDRIALLRETNAMLEGIAQALFKSWFVDFDPVHARTRGEQPAGLAPEVAALFPDSFEESELGMIPKGWSIGRISDLGDVVCGKTPPTSEPDNYGGDVPFITIPDMHRHLVVTSTTRALSKKGADSQPKKYLPVGSICVSCIATPGLVVQVTEPSHTNQQINSVIPQPKWGRSFPLFLLRRIGDKVHAGGSGGSVFHNLSKSGFEKIPELLPTTKLAQEYCQIVDPLVDKITDNQRYAQTLATLRDTLLPRLISGQLRLPEAEAMVREVQE